VLQCRRVEAEHWDKFIVHILAAHLFVMHWGVVLGDVIGKFFSARLLKDSVMFLFDSISYPIKNACPLLLNVFGSICCLRFRKPLNYEFELGLVAGGVPFLLT
jgi:hypothetical protein